MSQTPSRKTPTITIHEDRSALPDRTNTRSRRPAFSRPRTPYPEADTPRTGESRCTEPSNTPDNPFDDSHGIDIWTCPKCNAQWSTSAEREMNLERTGRYYFECESPICGALLVAKKGKGVADVTVKELQESQVKDPSIRESAKKGWRKSKHYVHRTARGVKGGLGKLARFNRGTNASDGGEKGRRLGGFSGPQCRLEKTPPVDASSIYPSSSGQFTRAVDADANLDLCKVRSARITHFDEREQHSETYCPHKSGPSGREQSKVDGGCVENGAESLDDDDDFLFYKCKVAGCVRTFGSEGQRWKHHAEEHPGQ